MLNLALLLIVSFLPFPTKIMGEELHGDFADRRTAALFYGLTFVALSFAFNALWHERPTPRAKRKGPTCAVDCRRFDKN
jgi:uncharacterized membrane protein